MAWQHTLDMVAPVEYADGHAPFERLDCALPASSPRRLDDRVAGPRQTSAVTTHNEQQDLGRRVLTASVPPLIRTSDARGVMLSGRYHPRTGVLYCVVCRWHIACEYLGLAGRIQLALLIQRSNTSRCPQCKPGGACHTGHRPAAGHLRYQLIFLCPCAALQGQASRTLPQFVVGGVFFRKKKTNNKNTQDSIASCGDQETL